MFYLFSVNAAADWVGGIFAGILFIAAVWFVYSVYYVKKTTMENMLDHNPDGVFKFISSAGTVCEAVTLSLISIQNGNTVFESFSRYTILGLFEVLTSFWFMSVISNGIKESVSDNNYNPVTFVILVLKSIPYFIFSFGVTALINFLYLESINVVEAQQLYVGFFNSLFGLRFESDPQYFATLSIEDVKRISIGAIIMIYSTTLVNVMLAVQQFKENSKHFKWILFKKKDDKIKDKNDKKNDKDGKPVGQPKTTKDLYDSRIDNSHTQDSLLHYVPSLKEWFTPFNESDFKTWINEYIGYDSDKGIEVNTARISPSISLATEDRAVVSIRVLQELTNKILGNDSKYIRGISKLEKDICKKLVTVEDSIEQYITKSKNDNKYSSSQNGNNERSDIGNILQSLNGLESRRKSMQSSLLSELTKLNFFNSNVTIIANDNINIKINELINRKDSLT